MRSTVIWLLALLMLFQVLTAVYLDVRGPAHVHVKSDHSEHRHHRGPDSDRGQRDYGHYLPHFHVQHHHVERHHHHPADPSVVTVRDHAPLESFMLKEETTTGWSAAMLAALLASGALLLLTRLPGGLALRPDSLLQTRSLGRLERPPRTIPL